MNFHNVKSLLDDFCKMAQTGSGQVNLEQFAAHLNVPISEPLREMFELYDRVSSSENLYNRTVKRGIYRHHNINWTVAAK